MPIHGPSGRCRWGSDRAQSMSLDTPVYQGKSAAMSAQATQFRVRAKKKKKLSPEKEEIRQNLIPIFLGRHCCVERACCTVPPRSCVFAFGDTKAQPALFFFGQAVAISVQPWLRREEPVRLSLTGIALHTDESCFFLPHCLGCLGRKLVPLTATVRQPP